MGKEINGLMIIGGMGGAKVIQSPISLFLWDDDLIDSAGRGIGEWQSRLKKTCMLFMVPPLLSVPPSRVGLPQFRGFQGTTP